LRDPLTDLALVAHNVARARPDPAIEPRTAAFLVNIHELIALLAAQAPRLDRALNKFARRGGKVVLVNDR
jgi:hypothetical protein